MPLLANAVGQSLSTRPDIIGSDVSKALSELHDKIPPFPREVAMKTIEEEFGCPTKSIFSYLSEEPVAAASFGQVYRGCTLDGSVVAVKVQRPNLLHAVVRDVYILRLGLSLLRKMANRKSDLALYADELGKGLVGELDYTLEATNATKFLEAHSQYSFMVVPKVFRHLTRKKVLTVEWMAGESPSDLFLRAGGFGNEKIHYSQKQQLETKTRLLDLVNKGVEASLVQLLDTGLLHADPHPGNLRYTPEGKIGFLDFGLLCQMEKKHQLAMLASIIHIVNGDWESLVNDLTLMDVVGPGTNLRRVTLELEGSLGEVLFRDGIPDIKFSKVLVKILSVALKYHFRMPPYFTLVLRSLASLEGLAVAADPQFKTFQAAYPYVVQKLLYDNSAPTRTILNSVVFNKKKEFQWNKILMFLRVGSSRLGTHGVNISSVNKSSGRRKYAEGDVFEVVNVVLRLLSSKNGVVLRRLLMTADSGSLTQAVVSKDAVIFRQHMSNTLADVIYKWMLRTLGGGKASALSDHHFSEIDRQEDTALLLQNALRDRRLRVISYKIMKDVRRQPLLTLRACWCCLTIFATASAIALHRAMVYWSESVLKSVAFVPKRFAVSV
ncbi:uncharacterized protein LOC109819480 isoform X2 [Asparagus officinalis]|uniref:uncharacterized protein LOC109819480 isoform X2 n=1 Tax=Asparagus officinalis TaxID=4686 RepID=UPI00098E5FAB|nr:uncharacterized protein LOC109819480 isoform X2 [Asparagus officinalis]